MTVKMRNLLNIAVAVIGALCLWIYVVTVVTPDDDILIEDIPISFTGETALRSEHGLTVTNRSARSVSVKFHGSRVLLKQLSEDRSDLSVVLDVSMFTSERDYSSAYDVILPASVQDSGIQVVERTPNTVQFTVEKLASRPVNVKGVFDGTVASNRVAGEMTFDQDTIRVTGPADLVDQVSYAQIILGGSNLSRTTTKEVAVTLIGRDGEQIVSNDLSLSATEVRVTLPVYVQKELDVTITPLFGGVVHAGNTKLTISPSTVTVLGDPDIIAEMNDELSIGLLDVTQIKNDDPVLYDILLPEGVMLQSKEKQVSVKVEFDGLEVMEVPLSKVETTNINFGLNSVVGAEQILVTLRGPSEELISYDTKDLRASADLSVFRNAGTYEVPVVISTGSETIAAVGEYFVTVELIAKKN